MSPQSQEREQVIAEFKMRLDALIEGRARRWQEELKSHNGQLPQLLKEFDLFARNYFVYIAQGDVSDLAHDLRIAVDKLQRVWAAISRACEQREIRELGQALKLADEQAKVYYDRFRGYKAIGTPITYFEKPYAITRYAFTPYPLISIPLQHFDAPSQWQGLAHELGHHIYWNSARIPRYEEAHVRLRNAVLKALITSVGDEDLERRTKAASVWMEWIEEAFCDIIGTLLVGPTYVISAQRRANEMAVTSADLVFDDGEHPVLYLRPLLGLETLSWVLDQIDDGHPGAASLQKLIDVLAEGWANERANCRRRTHEKSGLRMSEIEDCIAVIVPAILDEPEVGIDDTQGIWCQTDGASWGSVGGLVDYGAWLKESALQSAQNALNPDYLPSPGRIAPQSSSAFDELLAYLREKQNNDEKKVRKALLALDLGEARGFGDCYERCVKWAGYWNGYYVAC